MPDAIAKARDWYARLSRAGREFTLAGCSLVFGLLAVPMLIWVAGRIALGPYEHGGPFALLLDFLVGLGHGSPGFWIGALGPFLLLTLVRLGLTIYRR
ncbi:MAG: hypothetical protein WCE48_10300 [Steroidobacteraceae bacterium]